MRSRTAVLLALPAVLLIATTLLSGCETSRRDEVTVTYTTDVPAVRP